MPGQEFLKAKIFSMFGQEKRNNRENMKVIFKLDTPYLL